METQICPVCNKEFTPDPRKKSQTYCSRECWRVSLLKQVDRTCEVCGKPFSVQQARSDARFCSWECYGAKVQKECEYCGQVYFIKRGHARKRKTCSRKCAGLLRAQEKRMPNQGKSRSPETRRRVAEGLRRYYAGDPTKHWNFRNGPFAQKRGIYSAWQQRRKEARERDSYQCRACDKSEGQLGKQLSVHHIKPFRFFASWEEANALDNLICLCQSCHMKAEHGKIDLTALIR